MLGALGLHGDDVPGPVLATRATPRPHGPDSTCATTHVRRDGPASSAVPAWPGYQAAGVALLREGGGEIGKQAMTMLIERFLDIRPIDLEQPAGFPARERPPHDASNDADP